MAAAPAFAAGCAATHPAATNPSTAPASLQTATKADLIAQYNRQAAAITSLNASVTMKLTAGASYTGLIQQYHEISGFILARKPADIRVIGQVPVVGTNLFDMASDGETFAIFVPSKSKFITGPANLERPSPKAVENLRPQHLIDALFWPPIQENARVLIEEAGEAELAPPRYYVLTVIRRSAASDATNSAAEGSTDWEIARKIWFDRAGLDVARMEIYGPEGKLISDTRYADWDAFGAVRYPRQILVARTASDYQLQIGIRKLTPNEPIDAARFVLRQPPGTRLEQIGDGTEEATPSGAKDQP